ncbi:MAG: twin-arginine translocation signal domain-containing protein [Verrucomicrobia bacterium]|nr:twin-arginine translocation signal domain-containing protein [Verrucomicrobiota bacterium]
MPLHLTPISRRNFLRRAALAAGALVSVRELAAADAGDGSRWALLSDTHVAADAAAISREANMAANLSSTVRQVLAGDPPAAVFINGDCALKAGFPDDYKTLTALLKPLVEARLPVHMTLGNHDDRGNFSSALAASKDGARAVEGRHVSIVKSAHANWFLLDSLDQVDKTPGKLEKPQREWLARALDEHKDKPALVMVHHDPGLRPDQKSFGLLDTAELYEILVPRRHVKALLFGHTHRWQLDERDGLHLINLPAVSYAFNKAQPTGWVDCRLTATGATLELRAHDARHEAHAQKTQLKWRA